jgi:hypothetical protein
MPLISLGEQRGEAGRLGQFDLAQTRRERAEHTQRFFDRALDVRVERSK